MPRRMRQSGVPSRKIEAAWRISIGCRIIVCPFASRIVDISVNKICLDTCLKYELTSATVMRVSLFNADWSLCSAMAMKFSCPQRFDAEPHPRFKHHRLRRLR